MRISHCNLSRAHVAVLYNRFNLSEGRGHNLSVAAAHWTHANYTSFCGTLHNIAARLFALGHTCNHTNTNYHSASERVSYLFFLFFLFPSFLPLGLSNASISSISSTRGRSTRTLGGMPRDSVRIARPRVCTTSPVFQHGLNLCQSLWH